MLLEQVANYADIGAFLVGFVALVLWVRWKTKDKKDLD